MLCSSCLAAGNQRPLEQVVEPTDSETNSQDFVSGLQPKVSSHDKQAVDTVIITNVHRRHDAETRLLSPLATNVHFPDSGIVEEVMEVGASAVEYAAEAEDQAEGVANRDAGGMLEDGTFRIRVFEQRMIFPEYLSRFGIETALDDIANAWRNQCDQDRRRMKRDRIIAFAVTLVLFILNTALLVPIMFFYDLALHWCMLALLGACWPLFAFRVYINLHIKDVPKRKERTMRKILTSLKKLLDPVGVDVHVEYETEKLQLGSIQKVVLVYSVAPFDIENVAERCFTFNGSIKQEAEAGADRAEEVEIQECSICLQSFEDEQSCVALRCGHIFHRDCAQKWLVTRADCPMCRERVVGPRTSEGQEEVA